MINQTDSPKALGRFQKKFPTVKVDSLQFRSKTDHHNSYSQLQKNLDRAKFNPPPGLKQGWDFIQVTQSFRDLSSLCQPGKEPSCVSGDIDTVQGFVAHVVLAISVVAFLPPQLAFIKHKYPEPDGIEVPLRTVLPKNAFLPKDSIYLI